ncbi:hypothetical protein FOZ61_003700 [Perkinsus olseni]|uniref:Uncharacterized protein n=1 Tax=Perkinsus olseni TaxID=32597 RepID=A0A7J6LNS5_PEROL|nr:hypothetical protein FOZ61_003700 [Perkinsus olseni]
MRSRLRPAPLLQRLCFLPLLLLVVMALKRPRDHRNEWEPIIRQATANVDLTPYANGRGVVNYYLADKAREGRVHHVVVLCEPDKWEDAQYYDGSTKDPVYSVLSACSVRCEIIHAFSFILLRRGCFRRFCIRLHEKHHKKNKNLLTSSSRYSTTTSYLFGVV